MSELSEQVRWRESNESGKFDIVGQDSSTVTGRESTVDGGQTVNSTKQSRVIYMGKVIQDRHFVYRVDHRDARFLPLRTDLLDHRVTGFEWGHPCSGAAQLAIALLADAVSENCAIHCWKGFEKELVSQLPNQWTLTNQEIIRRAQQLMEKR